MPNLQPALTSLQSLIDYHGRILNALNPKFSFTPLLTFYLNNLVDPNELCASKAYPFIVGGKLYPAGVTTNSEAGVRSIKQLYPLIDLMQEHDLVLQIHGESVKGDIFEREAAFIQQELLPLIQHFPKLRIVLEHISTREAVEFIQMAPDNVAATITPHHLLYNRNQLLAGGIRPHYYCLPILKHQDDQQALQAAAFSGNRKFFAGTDSAPHSIEKKETSCGCAGIYSAPYALACYASVFDQADQLAKLNDFLSCFGAEFYRQPLNSKQLHLSKQPQIIPSSLPFGNQQVIPIAAGEKLEWSIDDVL